jgi:acetylornithine deacetylase/succinyl-diaminopimelate desuccinylase-like protein
MTVRTQANFTSEPSTWADSQAHDDLKNLVRLASVSQAPDKSQQQALAGMRAYLVKAFTDAGVPDMREVSIRQPDDISEPNPLVYGTWKVDPAAPTVLLYSHYDVVRADDGPWHEPGGDFDPFDPQEFTASTPEVPQGDVRLYGRGAADDKSGLIMHLSALRSYQADGRKPPVNLLLVLEGEEEIGTGSLDRFVEANRDMFQADVLVIADTGNVAQGTPTVTTSLRGLVAADVTVRTLDHDVHSGMFGGPAPDAFMVLVRMLDTLTDWRGNCAVDGLRTYTNPQWTPSSVGEEATFRAQCGVRDGVVLAGSGSITQRVAGSSAVNVVGLDGMPSLKDSVNKLHSQVTARVSVRIAPDQDPEEAYQALRTHLLAAAPYGVVPDITMVAEACGFVVRGDGGPYFATAGKAVGDAYATPFVQSGLGGTIPTINVLAEVQPDPSQCTVIMWGCEEPLCRIHSAPESVSYDELARMTRAEVNLLNYVAEQHTQQNG